MKVDVEEVTIRSFTLHLSEAELHVLLMLTVTVPTSLKTEHLDRVTDMNTKIKEALNEG